MQKSDNFGLIDFAFFFSCNSINTKCFQCGLVELMFSVFTSQKKSDSGQRLILVIGNRV